MLMSASLSEPSQCLDDCSQGMWNNRSAMGVVLCGKVEIWVLVLKG
jgi:hypothetical protein